MHRAGRAAIYIRTSTRDGRQHTANQIRVIRQYAKQRRFEIVEQFMDKASGSRGADSRGALADLLKAAHQGRFSIVLVFALDRFSREGVYKTLQYIERLKAAGVEFRSVTEEHINTAGAAGEMFLSIAASMAKLERELIRARIYAGLDRAKARGKKLGRPKVKVDVQVLKALRKEGHTMDQISDLTGHSRATIYRRIGV
jgi:DNA invertase Pin-like site-specific DNA recombinase